MTHPLITEAQKVLPKKSPAELKAFMEHLFDGVPADDIAQFDAATMARTAESHWKLGRERKAGQPAIKICNAPGTNGKTGIGRTVIDIVQDDMAFLIDSVVAEIVRHNHLIRMLIHPTLHVTRGKDGKIKIISTKRSGSSIPQSHIHIQLRGALSEAQAEEMEMGLRKIMADVDIATRDWPKMRDMLQYAQKSLSRAPKRYDDRLIEEYQAFLQYLYDNNFTLLGYREYKFVQQKDGSLTSKTVKDSGLGLLHDEARPVYLNETRKHLSQPQQKLRQNQEPLVIAKVNKRSTVHRRVPLDAIAVKTFDRKGEVAGEILFIGLFTSVTYSRSVGDIPYLRVKIQNVLDRSGFTLGSHDRKALRHILEKYPRDEVLQISEEELSRHAVSILQLQERPRIALYPRTDPFGRYISCLVYVPRERHETRLRLTFQHILEQELEGVCTNYQVTQDDSPLARVIFLIDINHLEKPPKFDSDKIEQKLEEAGRLWSEKLLCALEDSLENEIEISALIDRFGNAFPVNYHERYAPKQAVHDIRKVLRVLEKDRPIDLDIYKPGDCGEERLRLKIYSSHAPIPLSAVLPILENMGLKAISELPFEIRPARTQEHVWIHDFLLKYADERYARPISDIKESFEEAFLKVWHREMENDGLNRLLLTTRMDWREITVLRAFVHYMGQIRYPFSRQYMESALTTHPRIARRIGKLFRTRHDPDMTGKDRKNRIARYNKELNDFLEEVVSLDHDRILRSMIALCDCVLRTNFFQTGKDGLPKNYLSLKLDSRNIPNLPEPRPYREIFVYSPRTEGIHLRGDVIARGGLRWSDRHEDFRTEVLGLMKAQQVKNSVIVPMGAKGGFIVKHPPVEGGPKAIREEGIACYKIFIRGLLDITDNRDGEDIIPPPDVIRHDGDDPYLVVAADKGTATFSDIANSLSEEYGFWLGDAFASGGSAGYDHKKMGITARGAWESVKRHFRELSHDIQTQDFDVVGVGDMAGDVFGNGMLLSEHIRLIGAFNHLHIFCDPNPDPAASYKERKKLFDQVAGWDAYDKKKLSKGGRIFLRSEKSLELSPEICKRFDIDNERVAPNELIRAMLKARTDLLWFGGIGTYVKASSETNADAGDKGNDALRIDATEIRAKVIGEGANLAVTQRARIEYAEKGGHLNADYIDNAGGVDSSDHEVNIKILLGDVMRKPGHKMTLSARNKLLESMTEEVAAHVLRNNYQQAQGISLMELQAPENLAAHDRLIMELERKMGLSRKLEGLPNEETVQARLRTGKGLTRPELSVLQSYAKISYAKDFLDSDIPESKAMEGRLLKYFPQILGKKYKPEALQHRLRREIISTTLACSIVNRMGPSFVKGRIDKTGASCSEVAKAYIITREAFGLRDIWARIEALDNSVAAQVQLKALRESARMTERAATWFLTRLGRSLDINRDIADFEIGIASVRASLDKTATGNMAAEISQRTTRNMDDGMPEDLARDIALMPVLPSACDIIRMAAQSKTDISITAHTYFEVGEHFHLDWMRRQARFMAAEDSWAAEAREGLIDQLYSCQAGLAVRIIKDMKKEIASGKFGKNDRDNILSTWIDTHGSQARLLEPLFADLRGVSAVELPMLIIAEQRLRNLYGG